MGETAGADRTQSPGQFAGVLRELRKRARLTQEGLAEVAALGRCALAAAMLPGTAH